MMAGPCTVESEKQLLITAEAVRKEGAVILRGGAFKPSTSPYGFRGMGEAGLKLLAKARKEFGMSIITEVMTPTDVEMVCEYADILQIGTRNMQNYMLLDEVGRGTATFDGLSIAWAVVEHLQRTTRARTLFATHYHELTELAELLPAVKNIHVSVKETPNEIIFLRKVEPGSANKSYGIEVARLAGLPKSVVERARVVLRKHEQSEHALSETLTPGAAMNGNGNGAQNVLFTALDREILDKLKHADLDELRPIEALNLLAELKKQIR